MTQQLRRIALSTVTCAALLVSAAGVAHAFCQFYIDSTYYGTTPGNSSSVAVGPFTTTCSPGVYSGRLTNLSGASLSVQLEKQSSGIWNVVHSGSPINYSGTAGTYRYVVINNSAGSGSWALDWKHP